MVAYKANCRTFKWRKPMSSLLYTTHSLSARDAVKTHSGECVTINGSVGERLKPSDCKSDP
jgi:hypothetical protein